MNLALSLFLTAFITITSIVFVFSLAHYFIEKRGHRNEQ